MTQQDEYLSQIERILQKLEQARLRNLKCYGSNSHGYVLRTPLSEAEIEAFETREQIRLPEDYRIFLTHAGNGGAGPYNGIYRLSEWDDFADWVIDDRPEHFLALPCPLYPGLPRTNDWDENLEGVSPYQGTLSLGSQGCTYAMQLIVTGPYRGRVVYVDADDSTPYIVHERNFLTWYERWLDELLQGYNFGWFGYGPSGGEDDFLRILCDPQASDELRAEAAIAFCRLPQLSENAPSQIVQYLNDPFAGVRSGILATIDYFLLTGFANQVIPLLEDPSPEVRKQAVRTVMKIAPQSSIEALARRLREDTDKEVLRAAFSALQGTKTLTKTELLCIMEDPDKRSLRSQVVTAVEWSMEDEPILIRLLEDSDRHIRANSMVNLKRIKGRESLLRLLELLSREQDVHIVGHILKALGEFGNSSLVPVLLEWVKSADDFHRLDAMEALAKIGDERAVQPAQSMLQDYRKPERRDASGFGGMTHSLSFSELVRPSLAVSPNPILRQLVG